MTAIFTESRSVPDRACVPTSDGNSVVFSRVQPVQRIFTADLSKLLGGAK